MCDVCEDGVVTKINGSLITFEKCSYCEREDELKKLKKRMDAFYNKDRSPEVVLQEEELNG